MMGVFTQEQATDMILYEKYQEGIEQGLAKGRVEGVSLGRTEGFRDTAKRMLAKGMSIEEIQEITDLSVEDIEALKA